jgi:hypothetical protein
MKLAALRAHLDPAEHEHRSTRRHTARNDRKLGRELVARDSHPQSGAHY